MAEITKAYKQSVEAMRFVGKKYGDSDRGSCGTFGPKWFEWFDQVWFEIIEKQVVGSLKDSNEDGDAAIGLMRDKDGEIEYWNGYFTPENTVVPKGFAYIDFPKSNLSVCWVYGEENGVFFKEGKCGERLAQEGFEILTDETHNWCFERYSCRYSTPDDKGNVILDICFFVK